MNIAPPGQFPNFQTVFSTPGPTFEASANWRIFVHYMEPYVLFLSADAGIAQDYANYRAKYREKLEQYLDKFGVPPALGRTSNRLRETARH